jgi:hypothetical protein
VFELRFTEDAALLLREMQRTSHPKLKKVNRTLARIENDPRHPGLQSHKWRTLAAPDGSDLWESYVENNTPSAWRIWWFYGPEAGVITITMIAAHP